MQNYRVGALELAEEDRNPNRSNTGGAGGFFGMIFGLALQEQQEDDESISRFIKYDEYLIPNSIKSLRDSFLSFALGVLVPLLED